MISFDKDEKLIYDTLESLDGEIAAPDLLPGIRKKLDGITDSGAKANSKRKPLRLAAVLAAIAAILWISAAAVFLGGFDWLREKTELPFKAEVMAIEQSTQSEGIKFTAVAVKSRGDMTVLYATLEDIEGLGRITGDTQIGFESSEVQRIAPEMIYFDKETGIAAYQIRIITAEAYGEHSLSLQINGLRYGRLDLGEIRTNVDLAKAAAEGEHIGQPSFSNTEVPREFLVPGHIADIPGAKSAWISAIGVSQGYLTVQFGQPAGIGGFMNLYDLRPYLLAADENRIEPMPWNSGRQTNAQMQRVKEGQQAEYILWEYYFEAGTDKLDGYTLCFEGDVWNAAEGSWSLDVDLDNIQTVRETTADITVDDVKMINAVLTINPFGMTLTGSGASSINYALPLMADTILETANGDIELEGIYASRPDPDGAFEIIWHASSTIDIGSVAAIQIGSNKIELK